MNFNLPNRPKPAKSHVIFHKKKTTLWLYQNDFGYNRWAGNISLMDRTWIPCAALKKHGSQQFLWSHKGLPSFAIESGLKALALGPSVLRILHTGTDQKAQIFL